MRELYRQFKEDRYKPKPVLRVFIPKGDGRKRPLGIPTVKDRIAQATGTQIIILHCPERRKIYSCGDTVMMTYSLRWGNDERKAVYGRTVRAD